MRRNKEKDKFSQTKQEISTKNGRYPEKISGSDFSLQKVEHRIDNQHGLRANRTVEGGVVVSPAYVSWETIELIEGSKKWSNGGERTKRWAR